MKIKNYILILILILFAPLVSGALSDDVFASYSFNNTGNLIDRTGNFNLTEIGAVPTGNGKFNNSKGLFTDSDYYSGTFSTTINKDSEFSISFWLYPLVLNNNAKYFLLPTSNLASPTTLFALFDGDDLGASVFGLTSSQHDLLSNEWNNIILVRNGTTDTKIYVNNNLVQTMTGGTDAGSWNGEMYVGRAFNAGYSLLDGYIDELNFWNRTLNTTEINALQFAYYPFTLEPKVVNITSPACNTNITLGLANKTINFAWENATTSSLITYNLTLFKLLPTFVAQTTNQYYNWSINKNALLETNYTIELLSCDESNNCIESPATDCKLNICKNVWVKSPQPCTDNLRLISYTDSHNCNEQLDKPTDDGQYESCVTITYTQATYSEDIIILALLFLFLIVCLILAITTHEAFFGACALIVALMMTIFLYYDYPQILTYMMVFMILLFLVMWIVIKKNRR